MVGYNPKTLEEALEILKKCENATIFSGGTDLMVQKKFQDNIIFINRLSELQRIYEDIENWYIGAACTYTDLLYSKLPDVMKNVFQEVASPAIRNRGTIGGNICNASPAGDTLPMLYGMKAKLRLSSYGENHEIQERIVDIADFIKGVRQIEKGANEILVEIIIPKSMCREDLLFYQKKVGARKAEAISKMSFFGVASIDQHRVKDIKICFGAVGPTIVENSDFEKCFINLTQDDLKEKKKELHSKYMEIINPIDDQRSKATYRKKVASNILNDFLDRLIEKL
jgi:CO/xanthine dehydrogenase FAD-binding subunit